jgi:hypothetical protein
MVDTQTLVLSVLVIAIAVGVFYLVDPTLGGLLPVVKRFLGVEGFASPPKKDSTITTPASNPTNGQASAGTGSALAAAVAASKQAVGGNASSNNAQVGNSILASTPGAPAVPVAGSGPTPGSTSGFTGSTTEAFMNLNPSPMPFPGGEPPSNCYPQNQLKPQDLLPSDPNSKWAAVNPMGAGDISGKNFLSAGALIGVNTVGQSLRNANHDLRSDPPNPQTIVSPWMQTSISPDLLRKPLE